MRSAFGFENRSSPHSQGLSLPSRWPNLPPMSSYPSLPPALGISCALAAMLLVCQSVRASRAFSAVADLAAQPKLPDPLIMLNGDRVTTEKQWFKKRRPELKALFEHYMYGVMPPPSSK